MENIYLENYNLKLLKQYYNETYQSYLNGISPLIFMNDFLDKILDLTNSKSGYIMSIYNKNPDEKYLIVEALNKNILSVNEFVVQNNNMINLKESAICTNVANTGLYILTNNVKEHYLYNEPITTFTNIKTYVCYPIKYINKTIGIIGLADADFYSEEILRFLEEVSCLLSILMNNYLLNKIVNQTKRYISFQIMDEIINKTNDGIIIINSDGIINYQNELGLNFIKNIINDKYSKSFTDKNLFDLIYQFDFIKSDSTETKFFKNKSINLEIENISNEVIHYNILLNSIISNNVINHLLLINNKNPDNSSKKTQNNLVAFLSHELRNPLQSLSMATHLLQKKININDDKIVLYLDTISKSSNEMKRIINDILDLSKLESNEMELIMDNYTIKEILDNLLLTFTNIARYKNINMHVIIDSNVPIHVFTDLTRINQILSNLLSNAIKYSNSNSDVTIHVVYDKKNHGINFNIIDNGYGIPKSEYHNLFKENGKTNNSYKFDVKSNGFGLYLSQKIAHLLEGHISFISEQSKGSTFTLFHPVKLGQSVNTIKNHLNTNIIEAKILIVDDDISNLDMFKLLLENFKYEYNINLDINTANNGYTAINFCEVNDYNMIFMDINMPDIDGCTTTKIIKNNYLKKNIEVPVIATTGNIMAKKENQNLSNTKNKYLCFDDIIIKPYDEKSILSILNSYLSN
jgi:signal transduction histidine kinase/CheY-like chemotaxis protein